MTTLLLAACVGVLIGIVVGALGAGGGILSVPVLVYLLGFTPHDAAAGSLIVVGLTAMVSLINAQRDRRVAWRDGFVFGLVSVGGALVGGRLSAYVDGDLLMGLFCGLLTAVGIVMMRKGLRAQAASRRTLHAAPPAETTAGEGSAAQAAADSQEDAQGGQRRGLGAVIACATGTGFLTGFFGVGGGFIVVPMLVLALGFPMKRASGTSLLVMIIAASAGLAARIGTPVHIDLPVIMLFAAGSMTGGLLGGPLTRKVPAAMLTVAFGVLLLGVAVATAIGQFA